MLGVLRKASDRIFNQPALYTGLRTFFLGGLPWKPVAELLRSEPDDVVLDVGCGTGFFAEKISYRRYIGIDSDPKVIQVAAKRGLPHAQFILADCGTFAFETLEPRPTLAVLFGILHHLDDAESERLLTRLGNLGVRSVVTLDPVYSRFHVLNNALCGLDRGRFVRTEKEMTGLVARSRFLAEEKRIAYSNTKIAKYILFRLKDAAGEKWLFL